MLFEKGQTILFIGDSISDYERARPVGEGLFNAWGRSYVADVGSLLGCMYPELGLRITNMGISAMYYGAGFLALVWCAHRMLQGQMNFGSLTAVIQLVNQLQAPLVNLSGILPQYVAMTASSERLRELDAIRREPVPMEETPGSLYRRMDALAAEGVSFSYDRDGILQNVNFSFRKGPLRWLPALPESARAPY